MNAGLKNKTGTGGLLPRDRVLRAMRRERVDRVPLFYRDVPEVRQRLLRDTGLTTYDELLKQLNIDFRWVEPAYIGPSLDRPDGTRRDIWGLNGGFFIGPTHNFQTDCKTENILAMYEEAALTRG